MIVKFVLIEASVNTLSTVGVVRNVSAPGNPTVASDIEASLAGGETFMAQRGAHTYRFTIRGDGAIRIEARDAGTDLPIAPSSPFDTKQVHGGHIYGFDVL